MEDILKYTPMMQQYIRLKEDYADAIVFFRLGDFYEMFFDDALVASKVLEIALTARDAGTKVPMCGVPYHAAKVYIQKLVSKGFKVAIAEQVTEPGKGLVEREVIKLITPGMIIDDGILKDASFNFIGSIELSEYGYIFAYADISTGDTFLLDGLTKETLLDEIKNVELKEVVLKNLADSKLVQTLRDFNIVISMFQDDEIHNPALVKSIISKPAKQAASLLLNYLFSQSKQQLSHMMPFQITKTKQLMHLDRHVLEHLELTESLSGNPKSTLIYWVDQTKTAMGSRMLRYYLTHPIKDKEVLESRYDYIEAFKIYEPRERLQETLSKIYDINRLVGRIASNNTNARDLVQLKYTLENIPTLKEILREYKNELIDTLNEKVDSHTELYQMLDKALLDDAPILVKEGGMIKEGYNHDLDELRDIALHGESWLTEFENQEREKTGIKNLKVGYNRVFGYYIEVSKGNMSLIKDEFGYIRKQTLANGERYITQDLKVQEDKLLHAKEKSFALEYEIFQEIKEETKKYMNSLQELSQTLAKIDMFVSLAAVSDKFNYVRPKLNLNFMVEIENGRHPVVEQHVEFISNHITMKPQEIFILTGPNMSGKSTYMRMFALIVIMAQSGMFVPANRANLPIYDAIFTRIGSSDDIAGGQSTFMVEMVEANEALTKATKESLILFDEIGRGTATYDGMALAQGMIEYIHNDIGAQMMFSTHYHELTKLSESLSNVTNLHVRAKEEKDTMVFLHQVEPGASDKSYGIQVAQLAHIPEKIIQRSKTILKKLEKSSKEQLTNLFDLHEEIKLETVLPKDIQELLDELENVDIDRLTPVDALVRLKYLQTLRNKNKK
ncbi:DNA mismatch repair protein MutS [Acholeplasma equirhinis]|uniref:DNA mismatch repair protein MutS n=1 Tax=Acholeplasma equirhinis TaxID=555393 RepID=UPI00197AB9EA|nr:DNA mismatch repair protein MutS [Acholeplasma equirhinis]MBN3490570.1 DNA mismatch repair protein MutS [Acholeplasma equirhinis]